MPDGMVFRQRLLLKNVEPQPPHLVRFGRSGRRKNVDQGTTRGIDDNRAALQGCEKVSVDEMVGTGQQWSMQTNEVGTFRQLFEGNPLEWSEAGAGSTTMIVAPQASNARATSWPMRPPPTNPTVAFDRRVMCWACAAAFHTPSLTSASN